MEVVILDVSVVNLRGLTGQVGGTCFKWGSGFRICQKKMGLADVATRLPLWILCDCKQIFMSFSEHHGLSGQVACGCR